MAIRCTSGASHYGFAGGCAGGAEPAPGGGIGGAVSIGFANLLSSTGTFNCTWLNYRQCGLVVRRSNREWHFQSAARVAVVAEIALDRIVSDRARATNA